MKRVTKDRSTRVLTSTSEIKPTTRRRKATIASQENEAEASATPTATLLKNVSNVLSKYKASSSKTKQMKRPHVKVEYETDVANPGKEQLEIKQEPADAVFAITQNTNMLPCPGERNNYKLKSQIKDASAQTEQVKIKQEPADSPADLLEVLQNADLLPSPDKEHKYHLKSETKEVLKHEEVEIKQELVEEGDFVTVLEDVDLLPSPEKKYKYELMSQVHVMEMLQNLREMRKNFDAPVDSMGCDECRDKTSDPKDGRFQVLLSLILSAMTKDQVTYAAMQKLIEYGCTVDKMLEVSDGKLAEMIYPVNYWKKKVQYIKEAAKRINQEFDGDIPTTVSDLCTLKGVGPKIAHLCMKTAWGVVTGIGVDTHVHRISNRMGWVHAKTPEETRKQLQALLPQDSWMEVNKLLVGFGQQVCQQAKPQCATCLNHNLCPFGISYLKGKK